MSLIAQIFGKLLTPKNVLTWMPKSSSFKTPSCSQRVHRSQTLLKSARRHFYPNLPLIQDELSWKTYLWIRSKMLGLFLNTSTADHMYSAHSWEKIRQKFKRNYLKNQKQFLKVLLPFWNLHEILHIKKKNITLTGQIFWKLLTTKNLLTWIPKGSSLRTHPWSQRVHGSQTLLKCPLHHFYPKFPLMQDKLS